MTALIFMYFVIYSFFGWVCEVIYCSLIERRFVNRGFLNGPFCPIYGCGGLVVLYFLAPYYNNWVLIFFAGSIAASIIEYITSYILEKALDLKLWDYSNQILNINGRVCLKNSVLFGLLSVCLVEYIHPHIARFIEKISSNLIEEVATVVFLYFILDFIYCVGSFLHLKEKVAHVYKLLEVKQQLFEKLKVAFENDWNKKLEENRVDIENRIQSVKEEIKKFRFQKYDERRILNAFPKMKSVKSQEHIHKLIEKLNDLNKNI